ncbi:MAG: hypothetical protein QXZ13_02965 [Candidatus Diapherotrites archaeon]
MKYVKLLFCLVLLLGCSNKPNFLDNKQNIIFNFGNEVVIDFSSTYFSQDNDLLVRFVDKNVQGFSFELTFLPTKESEVFTYNFGEPKKSIVFNGYSLEVFGSYELSLFKANKITLESVKKVFYFNEPFTIKENEVQTSFDNSLEIIVIKFLDSRCPRDSVCVWEGELGVELSVKGIDEFSESWSEKIYLGEKTSKSKVFLGYEINLLQMKEESEKISALLVVYSKTGKDKTWFSIEPRQCQTNAWDNANWPVKTYFTDEKERIKAWLEKVHNIKVYDVSSKRTAEVVCSACSCPTGETIAVLVDSFNYGKMISLGWQPMNDISCTTEAKACPDGSFVSRKAPFCEFESCRKDSGMVRGPVFCTADVLECPDGSFVSRIPPHCNFAPCPNNFK